MLWVYLNWALGLRSLGCRVIWLETVRKSLPEDVILRQVLALKMRLERYGLAESLALVCPGGEALKGPAASLCMDIDAAAEADLLLNQRYGAHPNLVSRFRRTALLDIDPGLLQFWMRAGKISVAPHDAYFTIGETVGATGGNIPSLGLPWQHTPPCVALDWWTQSPVRGEAAFTTLVHWYASSGIADTDDAYNEDKRSGFLPYLDLPLHTEQRMELAVNGIDSDTQAWWEERGWRIQAARSVASTPWDYQQYIQHSRGEFSCAKPAYVRLNSAWVSDRTVCYLASGKPAVVQHTGVSRLLPEEGGLFRFRNLAEAARHLGVVGTDYERQCRLARQLAEELFDAKKVIGSVLERSGV